MCWSNTKDKLLLELGGPSHFIFLRTTPRHLKRWREGEASLEKNGCMLHGLRVSGTAVCSDSISFICGFRSYIDLSTSHIGAEEGWHL